MPIDATLEPPVTINLEKLRPTYTTGAFYHCSQFPAFLGHRDSFPRTICIRFAHIRRVPQQVFSVPQNALQLLHKK